MTISDRIRELMDYFDITSNAELARLAGVSRVTVGKWLQDTTPSQAALLTLKESKRINPEWVLSGEAPMVLPPDNVTDIPEYVNKTLAMLPVDEQRKAAADLIKILGRYL